MPKKTETAKTGGKKSKKSELQIKPRQISHTQSKNVLVEKNNHPIFNNFLIGGGFCVCPIQATILSNSA
jgi:hypothetical protein